MRILVTGASGLLGSKIVSVALDKGFATYSGYLKNNPSDGIPIQLDISNRENVLKNIKKVKPDVIIHCASLTDVDKCEIDKELARRLNIDGSKFVAEASKEINSYLVYISTDYVFDGSKGMYKEEDNPNPINFYGYSKLLGEESVKEIGINYLIARASVIYGLTPPSGKTSFALWLIDKLKKNREAKVLTDQYVSPTLNTNLAEMILEACEKKLVGIYHMSGASRVSRYEFAIKLAEVFNLNKDLIIASSMKEIDWIAKRPMDSSLDTSKIGKSLTTKPMHLLDSLKSLKEELEIA